MPTTVIVAWLSLAAWLLLTRALFPGAPLPPGVGSGAR
jgi:hypothetical protein